MFFHEQINFLLNRTVVIIIDKKDSFVPVEIKSGKTVTDEFFKGIKYWQRLTGLQSGTVIYGGDETYSYSDGRQAISWRNPDTIFNQKI